MRAEKVIHGSDHRAAVSAILRDGPRVALLWVWMVVSLTISEWSVRRSQRPDHCARRGPPKGRHAPLGAAERTGTTHGWKAAIAEPGELALTGRRLCGRLPGAEAVMVLWTLALSVRRYSGHWAYLTIACLIWRCDARAGCGRRSGLGGRSARWVDVGALIAEVMAGRSPAELQGFLHDLLAGGMPARPVPP